MLLFIVLTSIFVVVSVVLSVVCVRSRNENLRASAEFAAQVKQKDDALLALTEERARAVARAESLDEQLKNEREASAQNIKIVRDQFSLIAKEVLEGESLKFKATNKESLQVLMKPFEDSIREFKERVEKIHTTDTEQRTALRTEIENLQKLNKEITAETTNLTNALKADPKKQGDWGEMVLETILESFGFQRGVHYYVQKDFKNEDGSDVRPDVVVNLPEGKQIIIDSKVSLTNFVDYAGAPTKEAADAAMKLHVASVRKHVEELGRKDYQTLLKGKSPDFVIMFMPNEPSFLAALQADNTLWETAYKKNVIIASPTNLFALMKIVDDLWRRDSQSKNIQHIVEEGGKLYDKIEGFIGTFEKIGKTISSASAAYDDASKQLRTGKGNVIARCEKLRVLGVKAQKHITADYDTDVDVVDADDADSMELPE